MEYLNVGTYFGYQRNFIRDSPADGYQYASVLLALVAPLSRGTIDISSADAADPPVINPNWLTHPTDVAVAIAGYKRVRQLFATKAMEPILIGPEYFPGPNVNTDEEILNLIRQVLSTVFHPSSTCAMGKAGDKAAVVDSKARVFGVHGLRVVDTSAFPLLPPGHPMATVCKYSNPPLNWPLAFHRIGLLCVGGGKIWVDITLTFFRCICGKDCRRDQKDKCHLNMEGGGGRLYRTHASFFNMPFLFLSFLRVVFLV